MLLTSSTSCSVIESRRFSMSSLASFRMACQEYWLVRFNPIKVSLWVYYTPQRSYELSEGGPHSGCHPQDYCWFVLESQEIHRENMGDLNERNVLSLALWSEREKRTSMIIIIVVVILQLFRRWDVIMISHGDSLRMRIIPLLALYLDTEWNALVRSDRGDATDWTTRKSSERRPNTRLHW